MTLGRPSAARTARQMQGAGGLHQPQAKALGSPSVLAMRVVYLAFSRCIALRGVTSRMGRSSSSIMISISGALERRNRQRAQPAHSVFRPRIFWRIILVRWLSTTARGHPRPGRASGKFGHVRCAPVATKFRNAAK
jgi:hypothetical protein